MGNIPPLSPPPSPGDKGPFFYGYMPPAVKGNPPNLIRECIDATVQSVSADGNYVTITFALPVGSPYPLTSPQTVPISNESSSSLTMV